LASFNSFNTDSTIDGEISRTSSEICPDVQKRLYKRYLGVESYSIKRYSSKSQIIQRSYLGERVKLTAQTLDAPKNEMNIGKLKEKWKLGIYIDFEHNIFLNFYITMCTNIARNLLIVPVWFDKEIKLQFSKLTDFKPRLSI
jgi:hypothetical protein